MDMYYQTDIGLVRAHNEDSVAIFRNSNCLLAIVADGMGGHRAGDVASKMAIQVFQKFFEDELDICSPDRAEDWLKKSLAEANRSIYEYAKDNTECLGMGTTIVIALCYDSYVTIAHIGDSRCYLLKNNELYQLTEDHSYVNFLVKVGGISKEDAGDHPDKNKLTKALGTEAKVRGEVKTIQIDDGDQLLLCSDGLYSKISSEDLCRILVENEPQANRGNKLIEIAKENGGEDNITLVLLTQVTEGKTVHGGDIV